MARTTSTDGVFGNGAVMANKGFGSELFRNLQSIKANGKDGIVFPIKANGKDGIVLGLPREGQAPRQTDGEAAPRKPGLLTRLRNSLSKR